MKPTRLAATALFALLAALPVTAQVQRAQPGDSDQTLRAMRDEMERSKQKLQLAELERPYYIEYRLLDIEIRTIVASFGAVVSSTSTNNRLMAVDARVGDYNLDSSNFRGQDAFQGFLGSTGQVGIDRDYSSLRQDLWLATDQAYKQALDAISSKRGYIRSLARAPDIPDFSREQPMVFVNPRLTPEWTDRNWENEAKKASAALRAYPQLYSGRVTYHLIYYTYYMLNSEGTQIRTSRSVAGVEAGMDSPSDDGMPLHNFYAAYANRPAELPAAETVTQELQRAATELMRMRASEPAPDYVGPVLFEPRASASLLAQMLAPSISGARPALSSMPMFDRIMEQLGGRSEWVGRVGTRVLPAGVTLVDDPTRKDWNGTPLLGAYEVDEEGVKAQRVTIVENGTLKQMLMSRRPGPDFKQSNGHGRATFLGEARPALSNLIFEAQETASPDDLKKRFVDLCRAEGREWCIVVKQMDNPALAFTRQEDFSELIASLAGGGATGDRLPLLVYRVWVNDGRQELIRGARLTGLTLRNTRNIAGIGNDPAVFHFFQNPTPGFSGTSLNAFGSAQGGLPSSIVAPSLLFEDVEVRGARGEPRRPPLVPAPPLN